MKENYISKYIEKFLYMKLFQKYFYLKGIKNIFLFYIFLLSANKTQAQRDLSSFHQVISEELEVLSPVIGAYTTTLNNKGKGSSLKREEGNEPLINVSYKIITQENFITNYPNLKWMHIGRLKKSNSEINLHSINSSTDFSKINFLHDLEQNYAYKLYDGSFLIIIIK